jgi:hypothetical protein
MLVANLTLQKGTFCNAHHKSYPSEKLDTNQRLTCIDSSVKSGSFSASHQELGITHSAN